MSSLLARGSQKWESRLLPPGHFRGATTGLGPAGLLGVYVEAALVGSFGHSPPLAVSGNQLSPGVSVTGP